MGSRNMIIANEEGMPIKRINFNAQLKVEEKFDQCSLTAWAENLAESVKAAYGAVNKIHFDGMQYRKDIARRAYSTDING